MRSTDTAAATEVAGNIAGSVAIIGTSALPPHLVPHGALVGAPLGRRERNYGPLRTVTELHVADVAEACDDLAVADRVAYVLARRTGRTHLVVCAPTTFVIVALDPADLSADDAHHLVQEEHHPRIVSLASASGVIPLLAALGS